MAHLRVFVLLSLLTTTVSAAPASIFHHIKDNRWLSVTKRQALQQQRNAAFIKHSQIVGEQFQSLLNAGLNTNHPKHRNLHRMVVDRQYRQFTYLLVGRMLLTTPFQSISDRNRRMLVSMYEQGEFSLVADFESAGEEKMYLQALMYWASGRSALALEKLEMVQKKKITPSFRLADQITYGLANLLLQGNTSEGRQKGLLAITTIPDIENIPQSRLPVSLSTFTSVVMDTYEQQGQIEQAASFGHKMLVERNQSYRIGRMTGRSLWRLLLRTAKLHQKHGDKAAFDEIRHRMYEVSKGGKRYPGKMPYAEHQAFLWFMWQSYDEDKVWPKATEYARNLFAILNDQQTNAAHAQSQQAKNVAHILLRYYQRDEDHENAIKILKYLLNKRHHKGPNKPTLAQEMAWRHALVDNYAASKKPRTAIRELKEMEARLSGASADRIRQQHQVREKLANVYFARQQYAEASRYYQLILLDKEAAIFSQYSKLAHALWEQRRYAELEQVVSPVVTYWQNNQSAMSANNKVNYPRLLVWYAQALIVRHDMLKAERLLTQATGFPLNIAAKYRVLTAKVQLLLAQEKHREVHKVLNQLFKLNNELDDRTRWYQTAAIRLLYVRMYLQRGELANAQRFAASALKTLQRKKYKSSLRHIAALQANALVSMRLQQWSQARLSLTTAANIAPDNSKLKRLIAVEHGYLAYATKQYDKARTALSNTTFMGNKNPWVKEELRRLRYLAKLEIAEGQRGVAKQYLQAAMVMAKQYYVQLPPASVRDKAQLDLLVEAGQQ